MDFEYDIALEKLMKCRMENRLRNQPEDVAQILREHFSAQEVEVLRLGNFIPADFSMEERRSVGA
jgi:hypothetical protein